MEDLLRPKGAFPGIGAETGPAAPRAGSGIVRWRSPHGSSRYVAFRGGAPVSVLQVVSGDGRSATIANVFTLPAYRRQGLAETLLRRAERDFPGGVLHALPHSISAEGVLWKERVELHERGRNPRIGDSHMVGTAEALVLFIDNTGDIYRQKRAVEDQLLVKIARGVYDGIKARKAMSYVTEAGARRYVRELGESEELPREWNLAFPKSVRDEADKELVEAFWTKVQTDASFRDKLAELKRKYDGRGRKGGKGPKPSSYHRTHTYSVDELRAMPTISESQADNLKIDDGRYRVWLSRMKVEDGMPYNNQVTVEENKGGTWVIVRVYKAKGGRTERHESGRNPRTKKLRFGELPDIPKFHGGLSVKYLPVNNAYAVMWHSQVLRIFSDKHEAVQEARRLEPSMADEARAKHESGNNPKVKHIPVKENIQDASEFSRRRNMPNVDARIISSDRSQDIYLHHHQLGEVGSMHKMYKRGRHISTMYILPSMEGDIRKHESGSNPRTHHPRPRAGGVHRAVRYSGEVKVTLSFDDAENQYHVTLKAPGKMAARIHVRPPAHLTHAVDSAEAFDETARAALSLFSDEYPDVAEVAAMTESGYHVSRSKAGAWGGPERHESGKNPATLEGMRRKLARAKGQRHRPKKKRSLGRAKRRLKSSASAYKRAKSSAEALTPSLQMRLARALGRRS